MRLFDNWLFLLIFYGAIGMMLVCAPCVDSYRIPQTRNPRSVPNAQANFLPSKEEPPSVSSER